MSIRSLFLGALTIAAVSLPQTAVPAELVMLEEDGCWWCEKWDEEVGVVYHKTAEGRIAPLRRLNIHARLPEDLKFLSPGRYSPTFVLVDGGREIGRIRGYPGEDFFWGYLAQLIRKLHGPASQRPTTN